MWNCQQLDPPSRAVVRAGASRLATSASNQQQETNTMTKTHVVVCQECKSLRVQTQSWVRANTNEVLDDTGGYCWCDACEDDGGDGEQKYLEEVPVAECREAMELAKLEAELLAADPAAATQMEWDAEPLKALRDAIAEATQPETVEVAIIVSGGVVQEVRSSGPIKYTIHDFDDLEEGMSAAEAVAHVAKQVEHLTTAV